MSKLLVGTRKGLFTIERSKRGWRVVDTAFLGDRVPMVLADPRDGTWYAALDHGHFGSKIQRSSNGGSSWHEIAAPVYPTKPDGMSDMGPNGEVPWSLKLIWELTASNADQPGTLWCGTIPGAVFRSDDRGDSWQLVESLWNLPERKEWFGGGADWPGVHSICVHPDDSSWVIAGVSCGGVWLSTDGGASWNNRAAGMWADYMPPDRKFDVNIQDPHRIVQCRSRPESLWAQHHNGVFRTTDGGESWREVKNVPPSTFGFASVVHPDDGDTAWFVPAVSDQHRMPVDGRVVVARTRDGGQSFDELREGLPQEHAYDLVFRHALDIDRPGDALAFGSTTGSLWVSETQGDLWLAVSTNLPPIYCVRFAE